jgi:hypothetical protein
MYFDDDDEYENGTEDTDRMEYEEKEWDDGEIDACVDERVWDTRTEQFRPRSEVWCAFEDDDEDMVVDDE